MTRSTPNARMRKVNELLREVIADEVRYLKDPRIGFVTITGVETSRDLRRATVFYSVMGDEDEARNTHEALQHAAPHLQAGMAKQVRLKFTPRLEFAVDPAIETGLRMSKLLAELTKDSHDEPDSELVEENE